MAITLTPEPIPGAAAGRLPQSGAEAAFHLLVGFLLVVLSVSSFAVSTVFGVAATFVMTLAIAVVLPASMPVVIASAFLYQNMVVAWFTPYVTDKNTFDALRGANFVILMTTYGAFLAASLQMRLRAYPRLRPWLLISFALAGVIGFYLLVGAARGNVKDAIVYFRNTISPLACFHIALVAATLYRVDLRKSILWLGSAIVVYGYCELFFTMDFLGLFNGDLYIEQNIHRQIEKGTWEKIMHETGFVLTSLQDVMMTTLFNTPLTKDLFPRVFRIGGPNFHSISYAYALGIISVWLLFRGRWLLPIATLPLLFVIGSKGAMFMTVVAICARLMQGVLGTRLTLLSVPAVAITWIGAALAYGATHGDYHVLGFTAGIMGFLHNPFGQGLGIGGNLSSTSLHVDWQYAQATGATTIPVESAVGVMLYQMGIGSFVFFGFIVALILTTRRLALTTGQSDFWFAFVTVTIITANAVLQEEAYYSPLALGLSLLLTGTALGTLFRETTLPPGRGPGKP